MSSGRVAELIPSVSHEVSQPMADDVETTGTRGGGREYPCFRGVSTLSGLCWEFGRHACAGQRRTRIDRNRADLDKHNGGVFRSIQDHCRSIHAGMGDDWSVHNRPFLSSRRDLATLAIEAEH